MRLGRIFEVFVKNPTGGTTSVATSSAQTDGSQKTQITNGTTEVSVTTDNRLNTESTIVGQQNANRHVWVSPTNSMDVNQTVRLVGTNFDGTNKDTNFWTETPINGGDVTQNGEIELNTNTTANGGVSYTSVRKARFVVDSALHFRGAFKFVTEGTDNNIRRMGAYDSNNGFFFQLNGTTFSVGTRFDGDDTLVNSGSFNGNVGTIFTPITTSYYSFEIEWTPIGVFFYVNHTLLHQITTGHSSQSLTLPIMIENLNSNDSTTEVIFDCLGTAISRQGQLQTNAQYYHISGNAATHILKYGAGVLQKIMFNNTSGTSITIYDNTSAAVPIMGIITTTSAAIGEWTYNVPFNNGLTLVTIGNSLDATIIYE